MFQRPRLPDLVKVLRKVADGEGIEAPDAALALVARGARGSFRDAESILDQLSAATVKQVGVQSVLQLLGAVEEDSLFRLCDTVVDRDTAGALVFVEELAEQGQDLGRLVTDLLDHLRHLLLVQHVGHVPESLPVTEETRDRLREQANQLPQATVLRFIDLLAVAVDDMRQGGDPRLPLELALVKVTRPAADLAHETLAFRVERLEEALAGGHKASTPAPQAVATTAGPPPPSPPAAASAEAPPLELGRLQEAWRRSVVPAVPIHVQALLQQAHPTGLDDDTLTLEFASSADFHRRQIEEPKNLSIVRDALYEVTGRRLAVATALGDPDEESDAAEEETLSEEALISMFKDTFDAREVEET
jgi:DNA polymerase-3 subunit gamma/tau